MAYLIVCGLCGQTLVGCRGRYGDWMHQTDRSELCNGRVCRPETPTEIDEKTVAKGKAIYQRRKTR